MKFSKFSLRNTTIALAAAAGLAVWSAAGYAQSKTPAPGPQGMHPYSGQGSGEEASPGGYGPGYGMGPGMMYGYGGYGMGPGMMYGNRGGYGGGPGWRPGYGMGPGMMYGYREGYGEGPGRMRGYSMGPGMMYGWGGGYGMGPGWMGGYGGMGPGWMRGFGVLDLTDEQASKIESIYASAQKKGWRLGTQLLDARRKLIEALAAETPDRNTVVAAYKSLSNLRLQRLELGLEIRARVETVLTSKQREQLRNWRWGRFESVQ